MAVLCSVITDGGGELPWFYQLAVPNSWVLQTKSPKSRLLQGAGGGGGGQGLQMTSTSSTRFSFIKVLECTA